MTHVSLTLALLINHEIPISTIHNMNKLHA
jgi:hypothetical protein